MPRRVLLLLVLLLGAAAPCEAHAAERGRVVSAALAQAARALQSGEDAVRLRGERLGSARAALPGRARRPYVRHDGRLQVQVRVTPGADPHEVAVTLRSLGGRVERLHAPAGLLQATVPPDALDRLAADAAVAAVRPPRYAYPQAGQVLTLGAGSPVAACLPGGGTCAGGVNAYRARTRYGSGGYSAVAGRRIRVGVVSDGVAGLGQSVLSGDLPAGVTVRSFIDPPGDAVQSTGCTPSAEGRALLEIIHDLVPDAEIYFAAVETDLDYIAAVEWLATQVDVIVDDIAFFNAGPYDGSADVARVRTRAAEGGVTYVAAVGNSAPLHHRSDFVPTSSPFESSPVAHSFPGRGLRMPVDVVPGGQARVFLQWDGTPFDRAATDFDLLAFTSEAGPVLADVSDAAQTGAPGQTPTESVFLDNSEGEGTATFWIQVDYCGPTRDGRCTGDSPPSDVTFRVFVAGDAMALDSIDRVEDGSVPNGPDALGIVTTGAVNVSSGVLRDYSSRGEIGVGGTEVKPTVVGPDGVFTTVSNVAGLGGGSDDFRGTSAAAPHIGAVAAMVIAADPTLGSEAVRNALIAAASHAGSPNNERGHGLVDAVGAVSPLVDRDESFVLAPLPLGAVEEATSPTARVTLAEFSLGLTSGSTVAVHGLTASVRLGNSSASADSGTSGHERADLRQACVMEVTSGVDLGCGQFGSDDGRLLVVFGAPLPVTAGASVTLRLVYDLAVQPAETTAVAGRIGGAAVALAGLVVVGLLGRRDARGRRLVVVAIASLALSCGGGTSAQGPACPAPAAADAIGATEPLGGSTVAFSIRPLEPGDVIAVRGGAPVVPGTADPSGTRTVTVARP